MNLMIIEDEIRVANGIAKNIPWEKHNINIVGMAHNGKEALSLTQEVQPDIILLDIQMPKLDGLKFAEILRRELLLFPKIIILSAHDDFDYAQTAIGLEISEYLLKPAGDEAILESVLNASEKIKVELKEKHRQEKLKQKWDNNLPKLQEIFLHKCILGRYSDTQIIKQSKELMINLSHVQKFIVAVVALDFLKKGNIQFSGKEESSLRNFSLKGIAQEVLAEKDCYVISNLDESIMLLFTSKKAESEEELIAGVNKLIEKLLATVKECLGRAASTGIGTVFHRMNHANQSFRKAETALHGRMLYGGDIVIADQENPIDNQQMMASKSLEGQMEIVLDTEKLDSANKTINHFLNEVIGDSNSNEKLYEKSLYISTFFIRYIQDKKWPIQNVIEGKSLFQDLELIETAKQLRDWTYRMSRQIIKYGDDQRISKRHKLINDMLIFIEKNIDQDLTLGNISEKLYVNPSYLSRLFKKEMSISFSEYLLARKMKYAKQFLMEGKKVYLTSQLLGYNDVSYFSKVFRKYWGMTPGEVGKTENVHNVANVN